MDELVPTKDKIKWVVQRLGVYGYVLPQGWYVAIHRDLFRRDILDGKLSGRWRVFICDLIPPPHLIPGLLVQGRLQGQEGIDITSSCLRPLPPVCLQN